MLVRGKVVDVVDSVQVTNNFSHPPLQPFDIRDINVDDLFVLATLLMDLNAMRPLIEEKITPNRLLRVILADGANPGASENILQQESRRGLMDWRIEELIEAYNSWKDIQSNAEDPDYYETKLNAEALLAYSGVIKNRYLIMTRHWLLGIAASSVEKGDLVCILYGSQTPVILRARGHGTFMVIGQAYVEGLMTDDTVYWIKEDADTFKLV